MLVYASQPYSEAMVMRRFVTYTPCAISSQEQTGDILTFAQFEEENLLSKTCKDSKKR